MNCRSFKGSELKKTDREKKSYEKKKKNHVRKGKLRRMKKGLKRKGGKQSAQSPEGEGKERNAGNLVVQSVPGGDPQDLGGGGKELQ